MQEELLQFKLLNVWTLVDLPYGKKAIGTKWVFRNKKDQRGIVVRNKARLVVQGLEQEEGIDYDEVFAPVARMKAIRLFLAYASYMDFTVYQMDVKNAFLYDTIEEEVYVCQPSGFMDPTFPDKVYKVEKALYGLHQAPRAWYETLSTYLIENGFRRRTIDKTLFIKKIKNDILLVQVYVDDIIFGSTNKSLSTEFEQLMHKRFQMSSMRKLTFFLGLKVEQRTDITSTPMETHKPLTKDENGTDVDVHLYRSMIGSLMYLTSSRPDIMFAVCACSRFQVQPKASHMHAVKRIFRYLKGQPTLGLLYPKDSPLELIAYSNSDYAGASLDRKSTTGGCQFLGCRLVSWQCKKQTIVANSTTEAEYIAASKCCAQVLWLQNQLLNYGYNFMKTKIHMDNESAICVVKNPDSHSKTKHIEIRYHFIRDSYEKRLIEMVKIHTDYNVADLLTKAFDVTRFKFLIASIVDTAEQNFVLLVQKLVLLGSVSAAVARAIRCQFSNAARLILSTAKFGPYFSKDVFTMHNMVACLVKIDANADFHEIFWNTASSTIVNDEKQIHVTVDSKVVVVTEASIRSYLLFNDADGTFCLTNKEIFQILALMGSKSTSWNEFSINIASAVICLATNAKFNFSKLVFDGMLRNLDNTKKKFLMYPRFLTVFLTDQIELGEPFNDVYPTPAHTQKVFSNMARKSAKFLGKITPLFDNMLVPYQASEGEGSESPTEPQPTPSPTHHSEEDQPSIPESSSTNDTTQDSRDSLEGTHGHNGDQVQTPHDSPLSGGQTSDRAEAAEILKLKKRIKELKQKSKPVISHHRAYMRSVQRLSMKKRFGKKESVSKQGRKKVKPESTLDDNIVFDDLDADHGTWN
ncbi:putative ribonuclease H-like domain-containing protein [Tanacetum coccineum]